MLRLAIYFHVFFGFIFLIIFFPFGLLLLCVGFILILVAIAKRKADILEDWSILIRDAQGQGDKVISQTKELITDSKAPSIEMREKEVGPDLSIVSFGETREFLIATNRVNTKLSYFKTFINSNDYGNNLFVSWYLTYRPDFWRALLMLLPGTKKVMSIDDLNLFNKQDLTAYVTLVHHSLLEAVEKVMTGLNQDPSKIDRKSRGFLGIS
ncbi:MAG: hypothetical protein H8E54_11135 [Candidatus Aminicenantes bacterium]|nr:hypothetical protein [Candidatus Aminicenantes bacterium]